MVPLATITVDVLQRHNLNFNDVGALKMIATAEQVRAEFTQNVFLLEIYPT